jgi:hypothetical protein
MFIDKIKTFRAPNTLAGISSLDTQVNDFITTQLPRGSSIFDLRFSAAGSYVYAVLLFTVAE